jgi:hypothetical protein
VYPDNFMFESDYPDITSLSPAPQIPAKVVQDNAAALYGLG